MRMKRLLVILSLMLIGALTVSCSPSKDEELIEEFLTCWLQNSTANAELQHLMSESATVIGMGAEEQSDEAEEMQAEAAEEFEQKFEDTYGKYMTETALEEFMAEQYTTLTMLYAEADNWGITKIELQEEAEGYFFEVEIIINNNESQATIVQGRIQMENGVISKISNP